MPEDTIHLGARLKEVTTQRGILSTELARALGVNSQQVYRWHKQSDMLLSSLTEICSELDMDLDEFVYGHQAS
ncbi:helix-turn-helix transcriptional regulator [Oceanospirillaceae bacterium]|nr:helix-turn-helix transcriptional regulator [Oceanospirillaceae bacterium]